MKNISVHEFHCVIARSMKERLIKLEIFRQSRGVSGIIVGIMQVLIPELEREHVWGEERMSRYMNVCEDPEEERKHIHVYFPGELYRRLKLMHQDLNVYSIAQLLRGFLEFFLDLAGVYGDKVLSVIRREFARWKKEKEATKLSPGREIRQLWRIFQHLPAPQRLITLYDKNFSPFWILKV
jgi:hypothetical protein